jgi:hypothetical protein
MDGGRTDARLLHVKFLFDEIDTGWAFVRSASALGDADPGGRTLAFAQATHDTIARMAGDAPLTDDERTRLDAALDGLQTGIDDLVVLRGQPADDDTDETGSRREE